MNCLLSHVLHSCAAITGQQQSLYNMICYILMRLFMYQYLLCCHFVSFKVATSSSPNNLQTIHCGTVVNAAGPSAGYLAKKIGIHLPVEPRKRFIFVLDGAEASKINEMPFVIDCSGIGLTGRLEGFACGMSPTIVSICGTVLVSY